MGKKPKTMKFDEALWKRAAKAAKEARQSCTAYIEKATEEKLEREKK
jgi:hypothetical protein